LQVAFVTDTAPCPGMEALMAGADLAFVEGMFLSEHAEEGVQKKHLTVEQAAQAAKSAGAREMVLVHLSPRYVEGDLQRVAEEAGRHHDNAVVGTDGLTFTRLAPDE
jgi:ribonuclease Z